jgi:hypothetical protein
VSRAKPEAETVKIEIDHWRGVKRQNLAHAQPADDSNAERLSQFAAIAEAERQGDRAQQRRHGGHHDGAKAHQAGFVDGLARRQPSCTLRFKRKVDIMIAFFLTMPISRMTPISDMMLNSMPNAISASTAPIPAEGNVDRIVRGWM